jgi:hypothetical protein
MTLRKPISRLAKRLAALARTAAAADTGACEFTGGLGVSVMLKTLRLNESLAYVLSFPRYTGIYC